MATTKMKKYKMGGPGDEVTGSEQGKGANLARKLGTIIPSIGAAAVAIKAGMDKMKENREKKKIAKVEVSKNPVKVTKKDLPKYPKPNRIGFSGGITSKAKSGTSVGDPKTVFKPVGKSTESKPKGYNNNLIPLNPSDPPTKKIKKYATGGSTGLVGMPRYSNNPRSEQGRILKKGGATKMYKDGGKTGTQLKKEGAAMKAKGQAMKIQGQAMKKTGQDQFLKRAEVAQDLINYRTKRGQIQDMNPEMLASLKSKVNRAAEIKKERGSKTYKTGGMVNSNAKLTAAKAATGSVGGISKAISKGAVKSTSPKGKVGGTSAAPKCASPKKTK